MENGNQRQTFWWLVALAFVIRSLLIISIQSNPQKSILSDSGEYIQLSQSLRSGNFPSLDRTPGYPMMLVPFPNLKLALWFQAVLGAFTVGFLFLIVMQIWPSRAGPFLAALGLAFDFVTVIHTGFLITETFFVFSFVGAFFLFVYARNREYPVLPLMLSGFTFGLSALIRPIGLYFFILLLVIPLIERQFKPLLLFLVMSILLPGLWMMRNHSVSGKWVFSEIGNLNFYVIRAPYILMDKDNISYGRAYDEIEGMFKKEIPQTFSSKSEENKAKGQWAVNYLGKNKAIYGRLMMVDTIKMYAGNSFKVAAWLLFNDDYYNPNKMDTILKTTAIKQMKTYAKRHPVLMLGLILYLFFLGLIYMAAAFGLWEKLKEKDYIKVYMALVPIVYFTGLTVGAVAHARYRLPVMPFVFLLAGMGLNTLLIRFGKTRK